MIGEIYAISDIRYFAYLFTIKLKIILVILSLSLLQRVIFRREEKGVKVYRRFKR